jgi:tetratricopeptide (TPR) repeat protein
VRTSTSPTIRAGAVGGTGAVVEWVSPVPGIASEAGRRTWRESERSRGAEHGEGGIEKGVPKKPVEILLAAMVLGVVGLLVGLGLLWLRSDRGGSSPGEGAILPATPIPAATLEPESIEEGPIEETHASPAPPERLEGVKQRWVERNNEATRRLAEGKLAEAIEIFELCHDALPDEAAFRRNLAEALIRLAREEYRETGMLPDALAHLERAIELAPDREDIETLREILGRWRDERALSLYQLTELSLYFEFSYDASRDDILEHSGQAIWLLDSSYVEMAEWFVADPVLQGGRGKFRVVLYDRAGFDRVTGIGDWAGGVFDGTIRISVDHLPSEAERWGRVVRHELVHAFIDEVGGEGVPGWLNEGLAQYFDTSIFPTPYRTAFIERARESLRGEPLFPLEDLAGSLARWTDEKAIAQAYAQSLVVTAFIANQWGPDLLRAMVVGEKRGESIAAVFERWTGGVRLDEVLDLVREELAR